MMHYVSGLVYLNSQFVSAHIGFENGVIKEISKGRYSGKKLIAKGLVTPTFINAHTHIADSAIPFEPKGSLKQIVGLNGVKHRFLQNVAVKTLVRSMQTSMTLMLRVGISAFCDFREGGLKGVKILHTAVNDMNNKKADKKNINSIILGRPLRNLYDSTEINMILKHTAGIGVSGIAEWDYYELQKIALQVKKKAKIFALHASEDKREDIDKILDLKPNFLVHFINATHSDMEICAQHNIPVVICPRANALFHKFPPINKMVEKGLTITFGTDNLMFASPSVFDELQFAYRYLRFCTKTAPNPDMLLKMAFINSRKVLNVKNDCGICEYNDANFIVFEGMPAMHQSPAYWLLAEASIANIALIVIGGVCIYESKTSNDKKSFMWKSTWQ